jgi:hypothetical protein
MMKMILELIKTRKSMAVARYMTRGTGMRMRMTLRSMMRKRTIPVREWPK